VAAKRAKAAKKATRAAKKATKARARATRPAKRAKALPTLEVDGRDEAAIAALAEALVGALLTAAAASAMPVTTRGKRVARTAKRVARTAKRG
jgi:hypothetical protein